MNLSMSLTLDGLIRALRLTEHRLVEDRTDALRSAEPARDALPAGRRIDKTEDRDDARRR